MEEFKQFIAHIVATANGNMDNLSIEDYRSIVHEINDFLYANDDAIGTTEALGEPLRYFSDFHKYWHEHHREILDIQINETACQQVADALHDVYARTEGRAFSKIYDTCNLSKEDVCRVRFLTANQDFRGSRKFDELAQYFIVDNHIFDERTIVEDPADFVKSIGITNLSQNDKRTSYARNIASFLLERQVTPYELLDYYDNDVFALRTALISANNAGYGYKKTDMFLRDMIVLNIWENAQNFSKIDVASDVNTVKVALRTGIIKPAIPLVSSFLDIFCYQYSYVDEMNALAWRRVWEIWQEAYPTETIVSPCLLDYFIYNVVGKQFCKDILCYFQCETEEHQFKWHSSRNHRCQVCADNSIHNKAKLMHKCLPCSDPEGYIAIKQTEFVRNGTASPNFTNCPFHNICSIHGNNKLQPPKSISIKGQTGWTSAYSQKGSGGGGLMA